jgi:hypothetical protein
MQQRIAIGVDGCRAQLVEHLEGRLVVREAHLLLELQRGDARRERSDEKGAVEPELHRLLGAVHDRARSQRNEMSFRQPRQWTTRKSRRK